MKERLREKNTELFHTRGEETMTIQERAQKAVELKTRGGYNCSQAVTAALADQTGLTEEQLKQVAAGF